MSHVVCSLGKLLRFLLVVLSLWSRSSQAHDHVIYTAFVHLRSAAVQVDQSGAQLLAKSPDTVRGCALRVR